MKGSTLFIALCASFLLMGCAPKENPLVWTEEVVTPDQRIVTLRRTQYFDDGDYVGAHSFEFEHPTTKQVIKWQSDPFINFSLVALAFVSDQSYILVRPRFGIDSERAGCPYPSGMIFRWAGDRWEQIAYKDSPSKELINNATVDPKSERELIKNNNYHLPAHLIRKFVDHKHDGYTPGLTMSRFPDQVYQCSAQQKVKFK